jgi:hypothetical protein
MLYEDIFALGNKNATRYNIRVINYLLLTLKFLLESGFFLEWRHKGEL